MTSPADFKTAVREALDGALVDRIAEHVTESAAADAALLAARAPVVLAHHERVVLASMALGVATVEDIAGLEVGMFACRRRGLAYSLLRRRLVAGGGPVTEAELLELVAAQWGGLRASVELLVAEIAAAPVAVGDLLRRMVREIIAADAWSAFVADVRALDSVVKGKAMAFDDRRHDGALDATMIRTELRKLAEALTPALRKLEGL